MGLSSYWEFCALLSFLPTDPQTSMAATAAVSPSDYLQPAASTTQVSGHGLCARGSISLEGLTEAAIKLQLNTHYKYPRI